MAVASCLLFLSLFLLLLVLAIHVAFVFATMMQDSHGAALLLAVHTKLIIMGFWLCWTGSAVVGSLSFCC